ncbi:MAG: hypothetical protein B6I34_03915 [Anaerolineaceae bacterium 4572_32.1]|nr:MAG: hypothetical protein B6I34_03915 [Anaerolineaceae bacterium 4572_32.1]
MLGRGVLRGMHVTIKRLMDTYLEDLKYFPRRATEAAVETRQRPDVRGLKTIEYPFQKLEMFEGYRMLPFLIYDEDPEKPRCTACGMCARVCPPQCIWIESDKSPEGKNLRRPKSFTIDATICMSCGMCVEFCPSDAIKMDNDYEIGVHGREELIYSLDRLLKPVEYYAKIHPTEYAAQEEEKRKKAAAKAQKAAIKKKES